MNVAEINKVVSKLMEIQSQMDNGEVDKKEGYADRTKLNNTILKQIRLAYKGGQTLPRQLLKLSKVELVYNEDNKVSALKTYQNASQDDKDLIYFLAYYYSRSTLYGQATKAADYGMFTPLFMRAHKEYNGIPYEDWSKEDIDMPQLATGHQLWSLLKDWLVYVPEVDDNLQNLREDAISRSSLDNPKLEGNRMPSLQVAEYEKIPKELGYLKLQFWIAHPSKRKPKYQILDTVDWDHTPGVLKDLTLSEKNQRALVEQTLLNKQFGINEEDELVLF